MDGDTMEQALSLIESGAILSGPEDAIWDDIFDWIQNAVSTITRTIINWINTYIIPWLQSLKNWIVWVWNTIFPWLKSILDAISSWWNWFYYTVWTKVKSIPDTVTTKVEWLWREVSAWFNETWNTITTKVEWLWREVSAWFNETWNTITTKVEWAVNEINISLSGLADTVSSKVDRLLTDIRQLLPEWIVDPGKWVGVLLDGVADWLLEDIPGSSPRWLDIIKGPFEFLARWLFEFPKWFFEDAPERVAYGLAESFKWVSDTIEPTMETFTSTILSFARAIGPMSPDQAVSNFSSISKVGFAAIAGLTGMTVAGELLHPLKRIGLGNIAAVVWDMTNYKMITGAFIGALTYSMLRQPLNYYFNSLFRPMVLPERVFTELLSRRAFTQPELLQNPELTRSVAMLPYGGGPGYEADLIGYYGYPPAYHGLYSELANTRLGYFALAGIARTGFFDEAWFIEALARTGYSETARGALMLMFKEQVKYARQQPVMYHLRRLARDGFYTVDRVKEVLAEVNAMEVLDDIRVRAMELEQEYETYDMALDISLRSFSRGVISESECRDNLARLNIPDTLVNVHLAREKLGLIRRIPWAPPMALPTMQYVED